MKKYKNFKNLSFIEALRFKSEKFTTFIFKNLILES